MTLTKATYAMINGAPLNVLDFGAVADGVTDDYAAIQAAITAATNAGGGTVFIPAGTYKVNSTLTLTPISSYIDVYIQGAGMGATILDFSGTSAGEDGLATTGWCGRFGFEGFTVQNANRHGIFINNTGGTGWSHRFYLKNIHSDNNGGDGFSFGQSYMGYFESLESSNNARYGFYLNGFHTSFTFVRCWAGGDAAYPIAGNRNAGWYINNTIYSSFVSCAADWNVGPGYRITNSSAVEFLGCGAESNTQEGWYIGSSGTGSVTGKSNGISLNSCFGYNNGTSNRTGYANFAGIATSNTIDCFLSLTNCTDLNNGNTYSVVMNGGSGYVRCDWLNCSFQAPTYKSGSVVFYNRSLSGYVATATRLTNTNIPNATDATVAMTSFVTNEIGATLSSGRIVIPAGVNRVKVTGGVFWDTNSTGYRFITIYKNGTGFWGNGSLKIPGDGYTQMSIGSAIVDVEATDYFELRVNQNSGGSLAVLGNAYDTFLQIEVIG